MNIVCKYLVPNGYAAITIFPFVFYKDERYMTNFIDNHEKIHLNQQKEMLVIPFFIWYVIEFLVRLVQYGDSQLAYRNISFEREAYSNERDLGYLKSRKFYNWLKYL